MTGSSKREGVAKLLKVIQGQLQQLQGSARGYRSIWMAVGPCKMSKSQRETTKISQGSQLCVKVREDKGGGPQRRGWDQEITRKDRESLWKFFPPKGPLGRFRLFPCSATYWLHFVLETMAFTIPQIVQSENYCSGMCVLQAVDCDIYPVPRAQQETRRT